MKARSQTVDACSHAFAISKNGRPGHQNIGARFDYTPGCYRINASVHPQIAGGFDPLDHLANAPDLWQGCLEEMLMTETRIDRHDQYLVNVVQYLLQNGSWGSRVDHDAGPLSESFDALHGAMQVSV